ncbi:hypothetical protein B0570_001642 [Salmonella enterica subsp. enterica serovar Benue]|nr:hypothetical protein [Salmonella enterica subsp. enterica serovar Yovokome]ECI6680763.1 hypothetical protein [Salmonella enterica subsp. enterica]ECN8786990.1 hypothetical protein [Salmonella enterica subsp. enterica serovar Typhimurium]EDR3559395.1 hypothetical protein [Salmonella enterica subsp. enterica serovar Benue]EEA7625480.1 hypothetical protein [Salmonella enterica]
MGDLGWLLSVFTVVPCVIASGVMWCVMQHRMVGTRAMNERLFAERYIDREEKLMLQSLRYYVEAAGAAETAGVQNSIIQLCEVIDSEKATGAENLKEVATGGAWHLAKRAENLVMEAAKMATLAKATREERIKLVAKIPVDRDEALNAIYEECAALHDKVIAAFNVEYAG